MKLNYLIWSVAITFFNFLNAQTFDYGNVTAFDISATQDDYFKEAPAVIIYKNINYEHGREFEFHLRIKIYNKDGYKYANWEIPYNKVTSLKAATYNIVNGVVEITEVSKNGIFKEKVNKENQIRKIVFPNVKVGSVLEFKFKVKNIRLSEIYTQNILPIRFLNLNIKNPKLFDLVVKENPYVKLPIRRIKKDFKLLFIGDNIPALKEEKFVGNINNHRGRILIYTNFYYDTWKDVSDYFFNADWFGKQIRHSNSYHNLTVDTLIEEEKFPLDKARNIYNYVKQEIQWNKKMGFYSNGIKKAFKNKEGNIAEINLLLISMLKYAGLKANPMLISTKNNGWILYPSVREFNAVICALEINKKTYLLDAHNKNGGFGEIPFNFNNGMGLIINYDGTTRGYTTMIKEKSKNNVIISASLDVDNLKVTGNVKNQLTKYFAWQYRDLYKDSKKDVYKGIIEDMTLLNINNLKEANIESISKPINISYDFEYEDYIEVIGDRLYFEPLLFFGKRVNDYNDDKRINPIDIDYPYIENFIFYYKIPEGYKVESLPENKNISIVDDIGGLIFQIKSTSKEIQVSLKISINRAVILADYYENLYTLFSEYSNISNSKIVLSKT